MSFTKANAMAIIDANGGLPYLHTMLYVSGFHIPCQNWMDVEVEVDGKKIMKKMYVSRVDKDVFLENDYVRAAANSEWNASETIWMYIPWDKIEGIQMLDEKSRKKVKV